MAHTRMQRALPFTAADKIGPGPAARASSRAAGAACEPRLLVVQFGGPVGTRDGSAARAMRLRESWRGLDLGRRPPWHTQRDRIAEFGSSCRC